MLTDLIRSVKYFFVKFCYCNILLEFLCLPFKGVLLSSLCLVCSSSVHSHHGFDLHQIGICSFSWGVTFPDFRFSTRYSINQLNKNVKLGTLYFIILKSQVLDGILTYRLFWSSVLEVEA